MVNKPWCEWFADIEAAPENIVSGMTIRDVIAARDHLVNCDVCYDAMERLAAKTPPQTFMDLAGEN